MDELSTKVIMYRAKHNLSQKELGELIGVTGQMISFAESGKHIGKITKAKLEILFNEDKRKGEEK